MGNINFPSNFGSIRHVLTPKPTANFLSIQGDLMSKTFLICSFFKKSDFGWVEKQYLQLSFKGCCMLCLIEKKVILLEKSLRFL